MTHRASLMAEIEDRLPPGVLDATAPRWRAIGDITAALAMIWGAWAVLTFVPLPLFGRLLAAVILGAGLAHGILVGHNAHHGSMFRSPMANRLAAALTTGMVASAPNYRQRHVRRHHAHRDDDSLCDDLVSSVMRFSPQHPRHSHHRAQHLYVWPLLATYYAHLWFVDVAFLFTGRDGLQRIERPTIRQLAIFLPLKVVFALVLIALPLTRHGVIGVASLSLITLAVAGLIVGTLNLIGHVADLNRVPTFEPGLSPADERVRRILAVTADLSPDRAVTRWFLGQAHGLHVAHHLWPRLSAYALHDATMSLRQTCEHHGLEYHAHPTVTEGVRSVYRYLRVLGGVHPGDATAKATSVIPTSRRSERVRRYRSLVGRS